MARGETRNPDRQRVTMSGGKLDHPLSVGPTLAGRHMPGDYRAESPRNDLVDGLRGDITYGLGKNSP